MLQPYRNPSIGNYLGSSEILYFWGKFMNIVSIDCSYLRLLYTACKLKNLRQTNCTYLRPTQVFNLSGFAALSFEKKFCFCFLNYVLT